jgi:hypothetical protein
MPRLAATRLMIGLAAAGLLVAGCESPSEVPDPDGEPLMRTEASVYRLAERGVLLEVDIPFVYENRTGGAVYLVNCNGFVPPYLERKVDGKWRLEWGPGENGCLSPPVIIAAGQSYADTLGVHAPVFGSNAQPQFRGPDIDGIYRLRWDRALSSFDPNRQPFGRELPLELRVSNTFELKAP